VRPTISAELRARVQSQAWPSNRALLLVHGVGNAAPGDYRDLLQSVNAALGPRASEFAVYMLCYDVINDWFAEKTQLASQLESVLGFLKSKLDPSSLATTMVEVVGDVLWPVLSASARSAVRELYLAQLKQIVLDGLATVPSSRDMQLDIVCHSLGCYHTYEALHAAARFPTHRLQPATHGVIFANVCFMASPVQLIRTVANGLGSLVPKQWSATLDDGGLRIPSQASFGQAVRSVRNWVSITGKLDPVGGYFSRTRADWAYMQVEGQRSIVDEQDWLNLGADGDLESVLRAALRDRQAPQIQANNPHSWTAYVDRHQQELGQWLLV
jgi:hypothetical protein